MRNRQLVSAEDGSTATLIYTLEPRGTENTGRFLSWTMIITKLELLWSYLLKKGQYEESSLFIYIGTENLFAGCSPESYLNLGSL